MRFTESEIEWASRLRGAGLAWEPQPGHYVFDIDGVVKAGSPFQAGVYLITSLNTFEAMVGGAEGMHQHFSWLPTWEDARQWLQEHDVNDDETISSLESGLEAGLTDRECLYRLILERLSSSSENEDA